MLVRVLKPFRGSPNGVTVIDYAPDETGEPVVMSDDLAEVALREGWAETAPDAPAEPRPKAGKHK